ncbi:MAG: hypothetical protein M5U09_26460 [Gammaproteobacteria bacterium]|nr:hypothetical protein [Gammaproteobacteria bacterium]
MHGQHGIDAPHSLVLDLPGTWSPTSTQGSSDGIGVDAGGATNPVPVTAAGIAATRAASKAVGAWSTTTSSARTV